MEIVQITANVNIPLDRLADVAEVLGLVKLDVEGNPIQISLPLSVEDKALCETHLSERLYQRVNDDLVHYKQKLIERAMALKTLEVITSLEGVVTTSTNTITLP